MMVQPECQKTTARELARETLYIPETLPVNELLHQFRHNRQHIAIVLDEYGGTAGLVTLEDLLEEIVGEVSDPFDESSPEFQSQPDGSVLIDGLTLMEAVNQQLELNLIDPHYDTIAGYFLGKLGHIPKIGDEIEAGGVRLKVEADGWAAHRPVKPGAPERYTCRINDYLCRSRSQCAAGERHLSLPPASRAGGNGAARAPGGSAIWTAAGARGGLPLCRPARGA